MIEITEQDFSLDQIISKTRRPEMGAIVTFLGSVRNTSRGKVVEKLEFEADDEQAVKKLERIRDEVIAKFGVTDVSVVHRKGKVEVGENIVIIVVGAAHRAEAFQGCRHVIERLKEIVPIWKHEFYEGGDHWVGEVDAIKRSETKMVDISEKPQVFRRALAVGELILSPNTIEAVRLGTTKKGNVLSVSEIAGIMAAKKTSDIIPLCHQIPLSSVDVSFEFNDDRIRGSCEVVATYSTGVEMEALVGVTTALLSIWDMTKYLEKDSEGQYPSASLEGVRVIKKEKVDL
ncbi:MAG: cyclic pyranopterin monophosphate synthase MoaC [Candidatus Thorarchaeota archaeon]|jgi:cyclic pyranopterin phosphate synthase